MYLIYFKALFCNIFCEMTIKQASNQSSWLWTLFCFRSKCANSYRYIFRISWVLTKISKVTVFDWSRPKYSYYFYESFTDITFVSSGINMYRTLELRRSMLLHIQFKKLDSCSKFTMHASSKHLSHIDFNVDLYVRELKNIEMKKIDYNLFPSFPSLGDSHSRNFEKKKNSYEYDYTCRTSRF